MAGARYSAEIVIINVGARAAVPKLAGLDSVPWLDHTSIMDLRELPAHLLIVGGGYVGCEFGHCSAASGPR